MAARGRFVRDAGWVFFWQAVMTAIGMATGIITARWLGPDGRGLFQLVVVTGPFLLANLVKLGIPQASVYHIRREQEPPTAVVSNAVALALILGIGTAGACWLTRDWVLEHLLPGAPSITLVATLVLVPVIILQAYLLGTVQALERFAEFNFQRIMPNVLGLFGMILVLIYFEAGLVGAVFTHATILTFVCLWLLVRVNRLAPIRPRVDASLARRMLRFGVKSHAQTLAATWHLRLDQVLIGFLLTPTDVGLYVVAVNLTNLLLRIPDALGTVLFPRLAGSDASRAHEATTIVCRYTVTLMACGAVAYAIAGPWALRVLFGPRYEGSIAPMLALLPGVVMMGFYLILTRNFTSRNRQGVNVLAASSALVMNVILNVVLLPTMGIVGAALASVGSYGLASVILIVAFLRTSGKRFSDLVVVRPSELRTLLGGRRPPGA
jgi:O-antigen/teichoic acid export membrane protein